MKLHKRRVVSLAVIGGFLIAGCASIPLLGKSDPDWVISKSWTEISDGERFKVTLKAFSGVRIESVGSRKNHVYEFRLQVLTDIGRCDSPEETSVLEKAQLGNEPNWKACKCAVQTFRLAVDSNTGTEVSDWNWATTGYTDIDPADIDYSNCVTSSTAVLL